MSEPDAIRPTAAAGATSGVPNSAAALTGSGGATTTTWTSTPLTRDMWVDLNHPIGGSFWITNTLGQTAGQGREAAKFRITMHVDDVFVGGIEYEHNHGTSAAAWDPVTVYFRSEANMLPAGSVVKVTLTRIGGLADLIIGTGGDRQSALQMAYFPFVPPDQRLS